ncbi:hypothetical protein Jiend_42660 [Micromonospora endophytica]|nr:hypothetical protein Jiend_42660 [Micromonospora endophytica]
MLRVGGDRGPEEAQVVQYRLAPAGAPAVRLDMIRTHLTPRAMANRNRLTRALSRLARPAGQSGRGGCPAPAARRDRNRRTRWAVLRAARVPKDPGPVTEVRASGPAREPENGRRMWAEAAILTGVRYL